MINDLMGNAINELAKRISSNDYKLSELNDKLTAYDEIVCEAIAKFAEELTDEEKYIETQRAGWFKLSNALVEKARKNVSAERRLNALKMLNDLEQE